MGKYSWQEAAGSRQGEVRGRRSEVRSQRTEDRGQTTEFRNADLGLRIWELRK
jgi:hypothetical protein